MGANNAGRGDRIAIWALTRRGLDVACRLSAALADADIHTPEKLASKGRGRGFQRLLPAVKEHFAEYRGHVFIMAAGIVVRAIAPIVDRKSLDPAVVVMDEGGRFAVSLLSGHMGGANELAETVARETDAQPVITTATDTHGLPAIDTIAVSCGLHIANPEDIRHVSLAVLESRTVSVMDPDGFLSGQLPNPPFIPAGAEDSPESPAVIVDERLLPRPAHALVLCPPVLVAGIGCNRNTPAMEIDALLREVMDACGLAMGSLCRIASVDAKSDEPGLIEATGALGVPLEFFTPEQLSQIIHVPNPSETVEKHIGAKSVCEAAAILGARHGRLIVPKRKTTNVTVAIGRIASISSASAPAT